LEGREKVLKLRGIIGEREEEEKSIDEVAAGGNRVPQPSDNQTDSLSI